MRQNDKFIVRMMTGIFIFSIILLLWSITKAILLQNAIFDFSWEAISQRGSLSVYTVLIAGIFLFQSSLRDLIKYKKTGLIEHGMDERNAKILYFSTMNAGIIMVICLYAVILFFALFNNYLEKIFSLQDVALLLYPGIITWLYCFFLYYPKQKNI